MPDLAPAGGVADLDLCICFEDKKAVRYGKRRYWYFSKRVRISDVDHPVRIVLFWKERSDRDPSKALVSNRLFWEVIRILLVYRHRWTGTETYHRDGKQQLGLGDCQVRSGEGQTRHMYLVNVSYSLFMRSLHPSRPHDWARQTLRTIGEACRAFQAELLEHLIDCLVWHYYRLRESDSSAEEIPGHRPCYAPTG